MLHQYGIMKDVWRADDYVVVLEDKKPECNSFPCSHFYGAVFAEANLLKADCSLSHTTPGTLRPQEMSRGSTATVAGNTPIYLCRRTIIVLTTLFLELLLNSRDSCNVICPDISMGWPVEHIKAGLTFEKMVMVTFAPVEKKQKHELTVNQNFWLEKFPSKMWFILCLSAINCIISPSIKVVFQLFFTYAWSV